MKLSKLKLLRLKRGLKGKEVAAALGISPGYLSGLENGSQVLSGSIVSRLAAYYGCSVKDVLG